MDRSISSSGKRSSAKETPGEREGGLRLRQKRRQREGILKAATDLFRSEGYSETTMEHIADLAFVSLKTVYNYFPTKQSILVEILHSDREKLTKEYEKVSSRPPKNLADALARIMRADIGDVITAQDKKLWRELLAAETKSHDRPDDPFDRNRARFLNYIRLILEHFKASGRLADHVNIPVAVEIIYALSAYNFRQYCSIESITADEYLKMARRQTAVLIASWTAEPPVDTPASSGTS